MVFYQMSLFSISSTWSVSRLTLKELGATDEMLSAVKKTILSESSQAPFKGMETESLQNLLFRLEFGLVVSARTCRMFYRHFADLS